MRVLLLMLLITSVTTLPTMMECDRELKLGNEIMQAETEEAPSSVKLAFEGRPCGAGTFSPGETLTLSTANVPGGAMALVELGPGAQFTAAPATCSKRRIQADFRQASSRPKIALRAPIDGRSPVSVRMAYSRGLANVYLTGWCTLTPMAPGAAASPSPPPSPPAPPPPPPRHGNAPLVDMSAVGAPLASTPVLQAEGSSTLVVNLTFGLVRYAGPNGLEAAMFSYSSPDAPEAARRRLIGPTIRVAPNTTLVVHLTNAMQTASVSHGGATGSADAAADAAIAGAGPYATNLHLHAIHGSPNAPSDDYSARLRPSETRTYRYTVSADHQGGTHFYHPHLHGNTAMQLGGAALGALIIDETPGQVPAEVAGLEELPPLVLSHVDMPRLMQAAMLQEAACVDALVKKLRQLRAAPSAADDGADDGADAAEAMKAATAADAEAACHDDVWALGPLRGVPSDSVLVNGQTQPTLSLVANRWYRVRLIFSSLNALLLPSLPSHACDLSLLAKDGLPLRIAPRQIAHAILGPGSRADLLIRCTAGRHSLSSRAGPNATAFGVDGSGRLRAWEGGPGVVQAPSLLTLVVQHEQQPAGGPAGGGAAATAAGAAADELRRARQLEVPQPDAPAACAALPVFSPAAPCYLADLRKTPADTSLSFNMGPGMDGALINGRVYGTPGLTPTVRAGSVVELRLGGADQHPFHSHVNVFQLLDTPSDATRSGGYFRAGDWHDTLIAPPAAKPPKKLPSGWARVRMQADRYVGPQLLHCHNLEHSDRGQMMLTRVEGHEGDEWAGATSVAPTCHRAGGEVARPRILTPSSCGRAPESLEERCDASDGRGRLRRLAACAWRGGVLQAALLVEPVDYMPQLLSGVAALGLAAPLLVCLMGARRRNPRGRGVLACESERRSLLCSAE